MELTDDLFTDDTTRGRPSVPGPVMLSALLLQALVGLSDREAADALTFDLRWKAACGIPVDGRGVHHSTFASWRHRIAVSDHPDRGFHRD